MVGYMLPTTFQGNQKQPLRRKMGFSLEGVHFYAGVLKGTG